MRQAGLSAGLCLALAWLCGCAERITPAQRALLDEARSAYERQQYAVAVQRLDTFLSQVKGQPETVQAFYLRGMSHARSGMRAQAYADLRSAVALGVDADAVWRSYVVLGTLAFEDSDWEQAAQYLRAAADRMPDRPPKDTVLARLGMCFERTGRWLEARNPYRQIVERFGSGPHGDWARRRLQLNADHFAVQCGVFSQAANAETLRLNLERKGLPAFVRVEPRERASMHVVLVGRYARYEEAQRQLETVRARAGDLVPNPVLWP